MRNSLRFSSSLLLTVAMSPLALAQITPGNVIVTRVGDGVAPVTNAAQAVFLDQFTQAGVPAPSVVMPTSAAGLNLPFSNSGTATSEGALTQSADGRYLIAMGYGTAPGTASVNTTTAAAVNRVIARIDLAGVVDTTTALTDAYSANNPRGACSFDGNQFWTSGTASNLANGFGVRHVAALGATTSTLLSTSVTNIRTVNIFNGQLYCSSASGAFLGVSTVGTGLPTTSGQTITALPGFPIVAGPSSYGFYFADATTLYVADDRVTAAGGIQKWTFAAGTWTLAYTLQSATNIGCRGVSGYVQGGVTTLFATTTNNLLVSVVDGGAGSPFTTLATAPTNTVYRGVQFVRTPSSVTYSGTACATSFGTPTMTTIGLPVAGNQSFALAANNCGPLSFVAYLIGFSAALPFGVNIPGTPACALIYVPAALLEIGTADLAGNSSLAIPLPNDSALIGFTLGSQVAVFDFSLVGFDLPIGTSDAMTVILGN